MVLTAGALIAIRPTSDPPFAMDILFQDDSRILIRTQSGHEIRISNCPDGQHAYMDIWEPDTLKEHCISEVAPDRVLTFEKKRFEQDNATIKL